MRALLARLQWATRRKITGEASLKIKLAGGLAPDGGAKIKGNMFKEVVIDRESVPYANNKA